MPVRLGRQAAKTPNRVRADELGYNVDAYHWSPNEFNEFSKSKDIGYHFGTEKQSRRLRSRRMFFDDVSKDYKAADPTPKHYSLRLKNPYRMPDMGTWEPDEMTAWMVDKNDGRLSSDAIAKLAAIRSNLRNRKITREGAHDRISEVLQSEGYDGIVYDNLGEASLFGLVTRPLPVGRDNSYIIFKNSRDPSQIRNYNAEFDPNMQHSPLLDVSHR